jgi:hypothetical protein
MRTLDDKIIYVLNTSIPTDSFKSQIDASSSCKELFDQVEIVSCLLPEGIMNLLAQLGLSTCFR